jgi:hypothetical protein
MDFGAQVKCRRKIYRCEISSMSPGLQSSALQIASRVLNLIPLTFPVFKRERLVMEIPTLSESSVSDIFFLAIATSRFTIIAMSLISRISD